MPFSAEWLALREPADRIARSSRLAIRVAGHLPRSRPLHVLDLGCGTGASLRALTDLLPAPQHWLLVDYDRALIEAARTALSAQRDATSPGSLEFELRRADLGEVPGVVNLLDGRALGTASALLDLVGEDWLRQLVNGCRAHHTAVLFVLTYDGRMTCLPQEPEDGLIRELVNRHQRKDKGLGPALGPSASDVAERLLTGTGYAVERESSDWELGADFSQLQSALIAGWADAALEMAPERADVIRSWQTRRLAHVARGESHIIVGHQDLAGWLHQ